MTIDPLDKDEIAIVIAHAFGKKVTRRKWGEVEWKIVPFVHTFDFENHEYLATDEQIHQVQG